MGKYDKNDNGKEILEIFLSALGTTAMWGAATFCLDTTGNALCGRQAYTLFNSIGSSVEGTGEIGSANSALLSTIGGTATFSTETGPEPVPVIFLEEDSSGNLHISDNNDYARVERNAEKIYDTFNKTHEPSESLNGLVIPTPELAARLNKILSSEDKKTLYEALTALQEVLEEIENQKNNQARLEFKQK